MPRWQDGWRPSGRVPWTLCPITRSGLSLFGGMKSNGVTTEDRRRLKKERIGWGACSATSSDDFCISIIGVLLNGVVEFWMSSTENRFPFIKENKTSKVHSHRIPMIYTKSLLYLLVEWAKETKVKGDYFEKTEIIFIQIIRIVCTFFLTFPVIFGTEGELFRCAQHILYRIITRTEGRKTSCLPPYDRRLSYSDYCLNAFKIYSARLAFVYIRVAIRSDPQLTLKCAAAIDRSRPRQNTQTETPKCHFKVKPEILNKLIENIEEIPRN